MANFGLSSVALDSVAIAGKLNVTLARDTTLSDLKEMISLPTVAECSDIDTVPAYHLSAFEETTLKLTATEQSRFLVPGLPKNDIVITYTIAGSTPRAFVYHCEEAWEMATRYTYRFTVTLKKIQAGAEEEQWNTEIGGSAFEPEWSTEVSTGAHEATWGEEIGGQGYELTWRVEISAAALEAQWVTETSASASESGWNVEMGGSAGESHWNTETGAGANEENWNEETGGSASEEKWKEETGGNAFEAPWEEGDTIIIGNDPPAAP